MDPNLVADKDEREPRNPPIGVRATPTTHTSNKEQHKQLPHQPIVFARTMAHIHNREILHCCPNSDCHGHTHYINA